MDQLRDMGGAIKVAAVVTALGAYARLSDGIATANAQLKLATKTQEQLNKAQKDAYAIAQKQGVAYNAIATLLAKTTKAATSMGMEMKRAQEVGRSATAAIAAGIKVSGTGAQAAAAGVFQLSQALASGTLRGDELNSVLENIPAIGDAIAKQMGVTTGQLRKMGSEGKLSSEAVITALEKAKPELERLADLIPLTFGAAFTKVQNAAARLFVGMGNSSGFGQAMIASIDAVAKALDFLADNADAVGRILAGVLVAAAVKATAASIAAGLAARAQAEENNRLAVSALAAARAQQAQAVAALAVARANGSMSMGSASQAAAQVTASSRALAQARTEAQAAATALTAAGTRASLFGRAVASAAGLARAALAAIGGPIGLAIAGLVALGLWAGKAALSFKPIGDEAATTGDYIAEAFSQAGEWVSKTASKIWESMKTSMANIMKSVRPGIVWIIDAFLSVGRAVSGVAMGIVEAFAEAMNQAGRMARAMGQDAKNALTGNWGALGATSSAARAAPGAVGKAFSGGYAQGSSVFGNASGESVVKAVEAIPGKIRDGITQWAKDSGLREGANRRARERAAAQAGGGQDPGNPTAQGGDAAKGDTASKEKKKTFEEILAAAKEETRLAGLTTNEQEVQNALLSAKNELARDLNSTEQQLLSAEVKKKQNAAANLALAEETKKVIEGTTAARMQAAAEEARMAGNYGQAALIEAELRVQEMLNQAKRDGVTLDEKKVAAYRAAVVAASQENEILRLQQEAKRALQEIADNARKAMQSAVSDGIYAALSGDIKGVGDFFKSIGNILKRQIAETLTAKLFGNQQLAAVDSMKATKAAVDITVPAAQAVTAATNNIVTALNQGATNISAAANDNLKAPIQEAGSNLQQQLPKLEDGTEGWVQTLSSALGPLGQVIGQLINSIGSLFGSKKSGTGGTGVNGLPGATNVGGAAGRALNKGLAGAQTGMVIGAIGSMISSKFSQTGSTIGGAIGSFIPGVGSVIGSVVGGIIGGLFKKAPKGTVVATQGGTSVSGNKASVREALTGTGNSVQDGIGKIAQALGAKIGSYSVSIGKYKDEFRVSASGSSMAGDKKYAKKNPGDVLYRGKDEAEAIRIAILNAIQDGAIKGIREGTQRLLKAGKDIDAQLSKALAFENVFKRLKQWKDPVGAAVEAVDQEFMNLKDIFREAGASAEEYAQLEELYGRERAKAIEEATKSTTKVLQDFIDELKGGALGGQSLTDRVGYQDRLFSAMEQAQREGKTLDYDQLNSVGRSLIEATRELEGATPAFYDQVNRVMAVLEKAIADGTNPNVSPLPAPLSFRDEVATPVVDSIYDMNGNLVSGFGNVVNALNAQTVALLRQSANNNLSGPVVEIGGNGFNWNVVNF